MDIAQETPGDGSHHSCARPQRTEAWDNWLADLPESKKTLRICGQTLKNGSTI
jgi:hypothetical protein